MLLCHHPRLYTGSIPSTDQNPIVGSARVARLGVIKKIRILYDSLSTKDTVCRIVLCRALRKTIFCELCYDCATSIFEDVLLQASEIWQHQRCHCPLLFFSLIELLHRWNCKTCIQPRKTPSKEPAAWSRFTDVQTSFQWYKCGEEASWRRESTIKEFWEAKRKRGKASIGTETIIVAFRPRSQLLLEGF